MTQWTPLIIAALMLVSFALRRLTPATGFLHTNAGATVIAFIAGLSSALAQAIQAHGFSRDSLMAAGAGFVMSFVATANPSQQPAPDARTKQIDGASARVLLPLVFVALAMSACATAQKDTMIAELSLGKAVSLGYRTVDGIDKTKTDAFHNDILAGKAAQVRPAFDAYRPKIKKALAGLGAGADLLAAVDDVRQAADKGQRDWKDFTAYLPQLASMVAQIEALISDLKAVAQ